MIAIGLLSTRFRDCLRALDVAFLFFVHNTHWVQIFLYRQGVSPLICSANMYYLCMWFLVSWICILCVEFVHVNGILGGMQCILQLMTLPDQPASLLSSSASVT